jgi:hypothetical protein
LVVVPAERYLAAARPTSVSSAHATPREHHHDRPAAFSGVGELRSKRTGPAAPPGCLLEGSDDLGYPRDPTHHRRSPPPGVTRPTASSGRGTSCLLTESGRRSSPFFPQPQPHAASSTPRRQRAGAASCKARCGPSCECLPPLPHGVGCGTAFISRSAVIPRSRTSTQTALSPGGGVVHVGSGQGGLG